MADKVRVSVRVRPLNRREVDLGAKCVVDMESTQTILHHPNDNKDSSGHKRQPKTFAFDNCFWSIKENDPKFAGQAKVFECLGSDLLDRGFEGYNACIFAYGQTGSGKSYTMMGTSEQKGIIPRLCDALFEGITTRTNAESSFKCEVSYMEIYNEKVHDLLDPKGKQNLKVREHNILGPYVDGLSSLVVSSFSDIDNLMSEGNKSRTVAATNMNSESSRSHAVFNIKLTQTLTDLASGVSGEKVSKMSLVDLAGSERAQKTGAVGDRLKEGSNINKSLTTLGLVISHLADQAAGKHKNKFVPYRDSVLTWLLKDNLGGNSKTVMIATISPAADNYEETLSTLRYADRAKRIVNHAVVNEDPNARIIRDLRDEVDMLKKELSAAQSMQAPDLKERLEESEKLVSQLTKTWEEKLAETEKIHAERHQALEKMGISVQTSGIKVEQGKYYLVNLNADPSLNELLVYYLKDHTLVGRADAPVEQDIQLRGLGIMPEHCVIDIESSEVYVLPTEGARTCVNGSQVTSKTRVKHGDRIVWGNNHFFRINCPKTNSPSAQEPENEANQTIDFDFAQTELMMKELGNDTIQQAMSAIEKQFEDDKQEALERQRQMYEEQMEMLRSQIMSPGTPSQALSPLGRSNLGFGNTSTPNLQPKYQQWAQERDKSFKHSLSRLREEVVKANALVREANFLAQEMSKQTEFHVTLQIPASNLSPNRKRGQFVCEPAILVKRKDNASQVWSMEKFENKIIDMREMYEDRKEKGLPMMDEGPIPKGDPFYESQENHNLIGVANVFLECLFYDVKLDYQVPIISQQGEVGGRLHVEISRLQGAIPDRSDVSSECSSESGKSGYDDDDSMLSVGVPLVCRVCIHEARGLPPQLSHFVFCQYNFWGHSEPIVVAPVVETENGQKDNTNNIRFEHKREFKVNITEEFVEHASEGALSIEVWGHRSQGFHPDKGPWGLDSVQAKTSSLLDRWNELIRKIEIWVEIHELNDQGEYVPVEVQPKPELLTGGVFQLRQGQSRRIKVRVKPVQKSGTLPIICEAISSLSIGCVTARSKLQKGLDSYQEEDLTRLREKWTELLDRRKEYLDEQINKLVNKEDKTEADQEREQNLLNQWQSLTEERGTVLVPEPGSRIPGAPANWKVPWGMENHIPVLFLDLNADDMSTTGPQDGFQAAGANSILPKEHGSEFYTLPILKHFEKDAEAIASWDSSIHESQHLNRVTPDNEAVYLIVKAVVRLSHPATMELVLRKRICVNIYKRQSLTDKLRKRIGKAITDNVKSTGIERIDSALKNNDTVQRWLNMREGLFASGVTYEVVSNIPKASGELEDRETLAQMAASQNETGTPDGETYIEKYIKGVSAVESMLTLDRLRQQVAVKELMSAQGRPLRKTASVPNIHNMFKPELTSPGRYEDYTQYQMSTRSDSCQDMSQITDQYGSSPNQSFLSEQRNEMKKDVYSGKGSNGTSAFPIGNLAIPKFVSPQGNKPVKPMRTLLEEQNQREKKPLLGDGDESDEELATRLSPDQPHPPNRTSVSSDEFQEFESYQGQKKDGGSHSAEGSPPKSCSPPKHDISHSNTADSLLEIQNKTWTPSMTSSGYGSQAVSTNTLSSEDSTSLRSMSIEEVENEKQKAEKNEQEKRLSSGSDDSKSKLDNETENSEVVKTLTEDEQLPKPETKEPEIKTSENLETTNEQVSKHTEEKGDGDHVAETKPEDTSLTDNSDSLNDSDIIGAENIEEKDNEIKTTSIRLKSLGEGDGAEARLTQSYPNLPEVTTTETFEQPKESDVDFYSEAALDQLEMLGDLDFALSPQMGVMTKSRSMDVTLSSSPGRVGTPVEDGSDTDDAMSLCSFGGSRADLTRIGHTPVPSWIQPGENVIVTSSSGPSKTGTIRFVGPTEFASGPWVGVEIDVPEGKNDGSVKGVRYFKCRARHGIFVRHDKLIWDKKRRGGSRKGSGHLHRRSVPNLPSSSVTSPPSKQATESSYMKPTASTMSRKK